MHLPQKKSKKCGHEFVVCRQSLTSRGPYRLLAHSSGGKPKKELNRGKSQGEGEGACKQIVINYTPYKTNIAFQNRPKPKRKVVSNEESGAMLVSGRVVID